MNGMLRCPPEKKVPKYPGGSLGRGRIYTVEEVSELLGIPRPTLYRYLREYSIPHLRRSGEISIPEQSFDRIRQARDLHEEGLGTESVRHALREGGGQEDGGELENRVGKLPATPEDPRAPTRDRTPGDEADLSPVPSTVPARQGPLISAVFNLTGMVEALLTANGRSRRPVLADNGDEVRGRTPSTGPPGPLPVETPNRGIVSPVLGISSGPRRRSGPPAESPKFGSLARRRKRGAVVAALAALVLGVLLLGVVPALGGGGPLASIFGGGSDSERPTQNAGAGNDGAAQGNGSSGENGGGEGNGASRQAPPDGPSNGGTPGGTPESGSSGNEVEVPDVSGRTDDEAERALSEAGLTVADERRTVGGRQEAGTVKRTKPGAGSRVGPDTPVTIVVSNGRTGGSSASPAAGASASASAPGSAPSSASASASAGRGN